jgi:pimeloyl-ACP methyl ester carboxylesterase
VTHPIELALIRWGSGPKRALLLHGITSAAAGWWRFADDLASVGYEVAAPDLRGHGASPEHDVMTFEAYRDDVLALATSWDLVVGHSLGGSITLLALAARPDWAVRIILVDPALVFADRAAAIEELTEPWRKPIDRATIAAERPRWDPRDVDLKVDALRQSGRTSIVRTLEQSTPWDGRPLLGGLTMPTLILGADPELGSMVSPQLGEAIALAQPAVEFAVVRGGSHSMHRDAYDSFWSIIDRWLSRPVD